jgi:tRNA-dihydrouridine synthase B
MAGMTDTAFRRLVKRRGGCGLVVTEMVSSEGWCAGIDRTLEYAEYTEEERPVSIQIFGGDPRVMADAAQVVEGMGADIIDINMGCPVPKIAKHHAGCSLMREPEHAASVVRAMTNAVRIPVTVKMRAGWNEHEINAPTLARMVEDAGASAVAVHGRTAAQSYSGESDWSLIERVAAGVSIPVFGSGDCVDPAHIVQRLANPHVGGVLVGRGALRNPWILRAGVGGQTGTAPDFACPLEEPCQFLLEYIELLLHERVGEAKGFRHAAPGFTPTAPPAGARATSDGSSTSSRPSARGTPRGSRAAVSCASPSIPLSRSLSSETRLATSSCLKSPY